jgi:hypothetical protein
MSVLVGATINPAAYNETSYVTGAEMFDTIVSAGLPNQYNSATAITPGLNAQKGYLDTGSGTYGSLSGAAAPQYADLIAAGARMFISFKPPMTMNAGNLTALTNTVAAYYAAGLRDAIMYQECNGGNFSSATAYHTWVQYYFSAFSSNNVNVWYDPALADGAANAASVISYYPGDNYVTGGVLLDYYCSAWSYGVEITQAMENLAANNVNGALPFGIGEFGGGATSTFTPTLAQWTAYIDYLISWFGSYAHGSVLMQFQGDGTQTNNNVPPGDFKIPGIQLINALQTDPGVGTPYLIGSIATIASGNTAVAGVTTATAEGDAIVVAATNSGALTVTGVTDTPGNSYRQVVSSAAEFTSSMWVADTVNNLDGTLQLTTADTITVTYSGTSVNSRNVVAGGATGYSGVDVTPAVASAASGTSPAIASGTLAQASEVLWAAFVNGNGGGAPSAFTNCTNLATAETGPDEFLSLAYEVVDATTSVTCGCTIASSKWQAMLLSLEGPATPPVNVISEGWWWWWR